jgi:hypothetical protein
MIIDRREIYPNLRKGIIMKEIIDRRRKNALANLRRVRALQ